MDFLMKRALGEESEMDLLRNKALQGDESSIVEMASMIEIDGPDDPESLYKARQLWQIGMDAGYASCYRGMATNLELEDSERNFEKCEHLYRRAIEMGDNQAIPELSALMIKGGATEERQAEGWQMLRAAAKKGDAYAMNELSMCLEEAEEFEEALKWLKKMDSLGNKEDGLNSRLGNFYFHGWGCKQDYRKAYKYYMKGYKEDEDADAAFGLALCYHKGLGTGKNLDRGLRAMFMAREWGHVEAIECIGDLVNNPDTPDEVIYQIAELYLFSLIQLDKEEFAEAIARIHEEEPLRLQNALNEIVCKVFEERNLEVPKEMASLFG